MKTLVITNDYSPKKGGISTYLNSFVEHLNFEKIVYAPSWAEGENVIQSKSNFIFGSKSQITEIREIIESEKIELILHGSSNPQFLLVNKLKNFGVPQAMIVHGAEFNVIDSIPVLSKLFRNSLNQLHTIFSVSFFTSRKLQEITNTKIEILGAGTKKIDFAREFKTENLTIGVSSRFVSRKKINWVIDAIHELNLSGHNLSLNIFGFGKLENYLKKLADISSANIKFFKDESDDSLDKFYKEIDVFVMPSKSRYFGKEFEGLGLVYLEAGSYQMPVMVGTSGGAFETIVPGKTGFIVSSRNDIYDGINYFLSNPSSLKDFSIASKEYVDENFDWEKVLKIFENSFS